MGHDYIEREARYVAGALDNDNARLAAQRLRDDFNQMDSRDFDRLVNRVNQMDDKGYGADLTFRNVSAGRDNCGRQILETQLGVVGHDRYGRQEFHPVTSWENSSNRGRCDGGPYYDPGRGGYYPPRGGYDPRFPLPVPVPGHGHRGGGVRIGPGGIIIDIPLR